MYSKTCVILAAGRGSRMGGDIPKVLIKVAGKPILQHVIDFWVDEGVKEFIIVVGYQSGEVIDYIKRIYLELTSQFHIIIQEEQKGIADAILQVERYVPDRFIVALGDCLNIGSFEYPEDMELGYGIWDNVYKNTQAKGCNVIVVKGRVVGVYEKPPMDYAGIGTYFFDKRVFNFIRRTKPDAAIRNEVEIADVMTNMAREGLHIQAVRFSGDYINCTYPKDIKYANKILSMGVNVMT